MSKFLTISGHVSRPKVVAKLGNLTISADGAHPNKLNFKGILVRLDEPSTKPPQGAKNHLIQLPSAIAAKQLQTLIGMGVNYAENLDAHDPAYKVGVIEKAWIKGNALWVSGIVWVGDFPDAEKVLNTPGMGMSMELTRVKVDDPNADIWVLSEFVFTGATFLRKNAAAYFDTEAIAACASTLTTIFLNTEAEMPKPNAATTTKTPLTAEQKELAKIAASAATTSTTRQLGPILASIATALNESNKTNAAILSKLEAAGEEDEDDEVDTPVTAAKSEDKPGEGDDDDDWDDDSEDDDEDDEDDMDGGNALVDAGSDTGTTSTEGGDGAPGHVNSDATNHGNTSELLLKQGPMKAAAKLKARVAGLKTKLAAAATENAELRAENARLRTRNVSASESVRVVAAEATRKTLTPAALQLLTKNGMDAGELRASGQKLGDDEVDSLFRNLPHPLDVENRIAIKLELKAAGIMVDSSDASARRTRRA